MSLKCRCESKLFIQLIQSTLSYRLLQSVMIPRPTGIYAAFLHRQLLRFIFRPKYRSIHSVKYVFYQKLTANSLKQLFLWIYVIWVEICKIKSIYSIKNDKILPCSGARRLIILSMETAWGLPHRRKEAMDLFISCRSPVLVGHRDYSAIGAATHIPIMSRTP